MSGNNKRRAFVDFWAVDSDCGHRGGADDYRVAARVTDVFGNDGIAAIDVEVE